MRFPLLLAALFVVPAVAAELEGVKMPGAVSVEGKDLKLNGQGLRRYFVNVFVAGLYLEGRSSDGAAILAKDEVRRLDLSMLRDVDRKRFVASVEESFEKNAAEKWPALKERFEKFAAAIPDLKKGQSLVVNYTPGKGTRVDGQGASYSAEGKDFADAYFAAWIGKAPIDDGLKKGLLGAR